MLLNTIYNKQAQVSDITTWIFATLAIIVLLGITLSVANVLGAEKNLESSSSAVGGRNLIVEKSFYGYLLTSSEGKNVYEEIKSDENLDDSVKTLAEKIFVNMHTQDFSAITIIINGKSPSIIEPIVGTMRQKYTKQSNVQGVQTFIKVVTLNDNKILNLGMNEAGN